MLCVSIGIQVILPYVIVNRSRFSVDKDSRRVVDRPLEAVEEYKLEAEEYEQLQNAQERGKKRRSFEENKVMLVPTTTIPKCPKCGKGYVPPRPDSKTS